MKTKLTESRLKTKIYDDNFIQFLGENFLALADSEIHSLKIWLKEAEHVSKRYNNEDLSF